MEAAGCTSTCATRPNSHSSGHEHRARFWMRMKVFSNELLGFLDSETSAAFPRRGVATVVLEAAEPDSHERRRLFSDPRCGSGSRAGATYLDTSVLARQIQRIRRCQSYTGSCSGTDRQRPIRRHRTCVIFMPPKRLKGSNRSRGGREITKVKEGELEVD